MIKRKETNAEDIVLPDDVVDYILSFLPDILMIRVMEQICTQFRRVATSDTIWKRIFTKNYPLYRTVQVQNYRKACYELTRYARHTFNLTKEFDLVLIGKEHCGKEAMVLRYCLNRFFNDNEIVLDERRVKEITCNGLKYKAEITDASIIGGISVMEILAFRKGSAFMLCCATNDKTSLETLEHIPKCIRDTKDTDRHIPMIIVATKGDQTENLLVTEKDLKEYVTRHNIDGYIYATSAKKCININESFEMLTHYYVQSSIPADIIKRAAQGKSINKKQRECSIS